MLHRGHSPGNLQTIVASVVRLGRETPKGEPPISDQTNLSDDVIS